MKWMVRTYVSGSVVEKVKFPVGDNTRPRSRRRRVTSPGKQLQNDKDAVKRLARTINANYGGGDLWLTMKYSEEHLGRLRASCADPEDLNALLLAAKKERGNVIRKVKRLCQKEGIVLRLVAATSDVDGETGEAVRLHHHIIANRETLEAWRRCWPQDELRIDPLRNQDDYTPLATYILKQCRRQPEAKRYTCSRNLKKPIITEELVSTDRELRAPRGTIIVHRDAFDETIPTQYIRYIDPKKRKPDKRQEDTEKGRRKKT